MTDRERQSETDRHNRVRQKEQEGRRTRQRKGESSGSPENADGERQTSQVQRKSTARVDCWLIFREWTVSRRENISSERR